jgi:hypothetical protein
VTDLSVISTQITVRFTLKFVNSYLKATNGVCVVNMYLLVIVSSIQSVYGNWTGDLEVAMGLPFAMVNIMNVRVSKAEAFTLHKLGEG